MIFNCDFDEFESAFRVNGYRILECKRCKHMITDPRQFSAGVEEVFSDEYFFGGKDGYPDYTQEKDYLISQGRYYAGLVNKYVPKGNMLDVGAAAGFILKGFVEEGWTGKGIDPNSTMVRYGREQLGLLMERSTLDNFIDEIEYDLVLVVQVIAHLKNIPDSLVKINRLLKAGGHVLIETWNTDSLTAKLFGRNWHEFSPPTTHHYFSKKSLDTFTEQAGFSKVATGRPRKYILGHHARELIRFKIEQSGILSWLGGSERIIPGNMLIPYPSEDVFWSLYQKKEDAVLYRNRIGEKL